MRRLFGALFITILLLASITLIVLQRASSKDLGLRLPSNNSIVNQLVTNYVPVVFATFLEPFWLLLNRLLCILRPFEELRTAEAKPSRSIDLKYTSLPPQLVILRALRARHFLLVAVCATGLSANVMSVALSGLFQTSVNLITYNGTFTSQYLPIFHQDTMDLSSSDPSYVAKANLSDGTNLPPWVSRERYFLPFAIDLRNTSSDTTITYKAVTQGFGVSLDCVPADYSSTAFLTARMASPTSTSTPVVIPYRFSSGRNLTCTNTNPGPLGGQNDSKAALEVLQPLSSPDTFAEDDADDVCGTLLLAGFLRANLTVSVDNVKTENTEYTEEDNPSILAINSLSSLWMVCQPTLHTAAYSLTVDFNGRVQAYDQVGPDADDMTQFFSNSTSLAALIGGTQKFWADSDATVPYWHDDEYVDTYFAYFVKELSNSDRFVDPNSAVPTFDAIAPIIADIYTRIFAIILGLNPTWFNTAPPNTVIQGSILTPTPRIFMSRPALITIITLLVLNILVGLAYYIKRPKKMLKQIPTTIASVLEMFDSSGLVAEARSRGGVSEEWKIGYGRFIGTNGKPKLGIERRPFVIPLGGE